MGDCHDHSVYHPDFDPYGEGWADEMAGRGRPPRVWSRAGCPRVGDPAWLEGGKETTVVWSGTSKYTGMHRVGVKRGTRVMFVDCVSLRRRDGDRGCERDGGDATVLKALK